MAFPESNLFRRYIFSCVLLIISIATSALVWGHWSYTLNTCSGYNCGCILSGTAYSQNFAGGRIQLCEFVTIVQIPIFIISCVLVFYYGYRVLIKTKRKRTSALETTSRRTPLSHKQRPDGKAIVLDSQPSINEPPRFAIRLTLFIISLIIVVCLLTASIIIIQGFYASCNEYRTILLRQLGFTGNAAEVLNNRLTCFSIFDFLDYLQPDRKDFDSPYSYQRTDRINTGVTLVLAKTALTMNTINWIILSFRNGQQLRTNGKCCGK